MRGKYLGLVLGGVVASVAFALPAQATLYRYYRCHFDSPVGSAFRMIDGGPSTQIPNLPVTFNLFTDHTVRHISNR